MAKTLMNLWHDAVFHLWGNRCVVCGGFGERLDAHHVYGRGMLIRFDWYNGVPACGFPRSCHAFLQTKTGKEFLRRKVLGDHWMDELSKKSKIIIKDHIKRLGITHQEYMEGVKNELKKAIDRPFGVLKTKDGRKDINASEGNISL